MFNMAQKKIIVALHKDGVDYKKIAKTLKLHGQPKKLNAQAQRHIQRLCLGDRCMSAASIAAEVEGVGGQPVSAQTICRTLHQIGLNGCRPRREPLLKMTDKKTRKQFAKDKQTKGPYTPGRISARVIRQRFSTRFLCSHTSDFRWRWADCRVNMQIHSLTLDGA